MTDIFTLPPPPDPVKVQQWAGQARALATLFGGVLAGVGIVLPAFTDAQLNGYISAAMTVAGLAAYAVSAIRSWRQKAEQRAVTVASAAASATLGQPVTVAVTPPGQPNIVSKVSSTELAQAPSAPLNVVPSPAPAGP